MQSLIQNLLQSVRRHPGIIMALALVFYANTLLNDFAVDDSIVIVKNEYVQKGLAGIPDILGKDTFRGFFKTEGKDKLVSGGRYRPLSLVLFAFICQVFGNTAWIYHLVNVLLFALLGAVLYKVLAGLTDRTFPKQSAALAFLAAVLFVIHPVHTECVANIKGADEIIALLLSLTAFLMVLRWTKSGKSQQLWLGALSLGVAMFSKENSVSYLALIPAGLLLFKKTNLSGALRIFGVLFIPVFFFLFCRAQILGWNPIAGQSMELMNNPFLKFVKDHYVAFTPSEKTGTILYTLLRYTGLLLFPHPLSYDYYPMQIAIHSIGSPSALLSLILYGGMVAAVWIYRRSNPLVSFSLMAYLIPLFIVSNLLFSVGTFMGERFLFMPSVGFVLLAAWLLLRLMEKNAALVSLLLVAMVALCAVKTITRNTDWKDDLTLIMNDIRISPNSAKLNTAVGGILLEKYSTSKDQRLLQEKMSLAKTHLRRAIEMHPLYFEAHKLLGNAHFVSKEYKEALARFEFILKYNPGDNDASNNLALTYRELGRVAGMQENNPAQAIDYLNRSLQLNGKDEEAISLTGVAYGVMGQYQQALSQFNKVLALNPGSANAYFNLYLTYMNMGDQAQAEAMLGKAKSLDPEIMNRFNQGRQ